MFLGGWLRPGSSCLDGWGQVGESQPQKLLSFRVIMEFLKCKTDAWEAECSLQSLILICKYISISPKLFISASTHLPHLWWQLPLDLTKEVLFCRWSSHSTWVHPSLLFETSIRGANSWSTIYSRSLQKYTMLLSPYRCVANRELSGYASFLYIFQLNQKSKCKSQHLGMSTWTCDSPAWVLRL